MTKAEKFYKEHLRKQKKVEGQFVGRMHSSSVEAIMGRMNDPGSFDLVDSKHWPLDSADCMRVLTVFRAKNAYGGVVTQSCITLVDSAGAVYALQVVE